MSHETLISIDSEIVKYSLVFYVDPKNKLLQYKSIGNFFFAVKSGSDVDLAPEVERRDDAEKKKRPTVEKTCKFNDMCFGDLGPQSTAKSVNYCCENQSVWDQNQQTSYFALIKTSSVRLSFSLEIHAWTGVGLK